MLDGKKSLDTLVLTFLIDRVGGALSSKIVYQ